MATTDLIAAIELGSSRILGIVGKWNADNSLQVLAYAQKESSAFIRKGLIYNREKTVQALSSLIKQLESCLEDSITITKVYIGIGGQSFRTVTNRINRTLKEEDAISQALVDSICDENHQTDENILDVAPQEYKIDNALYTDPVGVVGHNITGLFLNIVAREGVKRNLTRSLELAKIRMADDLLISPIALAKILLTEKEMRLGCALIDFGADTTTLSIYKNNLLRYLTVLPLGGNTITRDIASFPMEEEEAEKVKLLHGNACCEKEEEVAEEAVESAVCVLEDGREINLSLLSDIVEARCEEILSNVWDQLELSGYVNKLAAGIMFTGGGSNLKNLEKAFLKVGKRENLKVKRLPFVHTTIRGFEEELKRDGRQNTLLGLLAAGKENCCEKQSPKSSETTASSQRDLFFGDEAGLSSETPPKSPISKEKEKKEKKEEKKGKKEKNFTKRIKEKLDSFTATIFEDSELK